MSLKQRRYECYVHVSYSGIQKQTNELKFCVFILFVNFAFYRSFMFLFFIKIIRVYQGLLKLYSAFDIVFMPSSKRC